MPHDTDRLTLALMCARDLAGALEDDARNEAYDPVERAVIHQAHLAALHLVEQLRPAVEMVRSKHTEGALAE